MDVQSPNIQMTKSNKITNRKLIKKFNQTISTIAQKTLKLQQTNIALTNHSKSMLLSAKMNLKLKSLQQNKTLPFTHRSNQIQKNNFYDSIDKWKNIKMQKTKSNNRYDNQNSQIYSQSMDMNLFKNFKKQSLINDNQLFLTVQNSFNDLSNSMPRNSKQFKEQLLKKDVLISKNKLKLNRKWNFQQFLFNLYLQKTKDLKTKPILKQQKLFVERFKQKFKCFDQSQIQNCYQNGKYGRSLIKQINAASSDFGINSIRCVCQYLLSNKLSQRISISQNYNLYNLKSIVLDKNPLGDESILILSQALTYFKNLQKLSLVSVGISPKSAPQLLKSLVGHECLKQVDFSSSQGLNRNRFGQSIGQIQLILNHPSCVWQELNLTSVNFGQNGFSLLANGITKQSKLQRLSVSQNDIQPQDITFFLSKFKFTQLKYLDISHNFIGDQGFCLISQTIGSQYGHNMLSRSLQVLNVSNNQIKSYGIQVFCKNMINNQALIELDLSNNSLWKGQKFFHFKYFISKNWTIKRINFLNCFSSSDDVKHLFEGIQQNRVVEQLILSKNNISVENFTFLAKALSTNKGLKKIDLDCCNIGDKHILKHQKDLKQIKNLEELNLSNNYLSDKCSKVLLEILNISKSIIKGSFIKNCLGVKTQNQINLILKSNKNRKQTTKQDQKEFQYLNYVTQIQNNHQETIKSTIQKLQKKQERVKYTSLVCQCIKAEIQQDEKKKELKSQLMRIKQLEQKLKKSQPIQI